MMVQRDLLLLWQLSRHVSEASRRAHPEVPWQRFHEIWRGLVEPLEPYFLLSGAEIAAIIRTELPAIVLALEAMLPTLSRQD